MKIKSLFLILLLSFSFTACSSPDEQLLEGIRKNDIKSVQKSIAKGANISGLNSEGYTPLMTSVMGKADTEIIKLLLEKGANPNSKITIKEEDKDRETTPLFYAADLGNIELTKLLLDYGGDPNIKLSSDPILTRVIGKYARTTNKNYLTIAKNLLEKGADPNIKSEPDGFCPMLAAMTANTEAETFELIKLLLSYGADPNVEFGGVSPLIGAIQQNYIKVMKLLLANKAKVNTKTHLSDPRLDKEIKNLSPLAAAIVSENLEATKLLLRHGADINVTGTMYNEKTNFQALASALPLAVMYKNKDIIRLLLNYGANVNDTAMNGQNKLSVLSFAVGTQDLEIIKMLINNGAVPAPEAVLIAMTLGNKDIVNFFRSLDQKKIIKNTEALFNAIIYSSDVLSAEKFIKDIAILSSEFKGNTPLMLAVASKNKEMVKLLLDNGANINIKDKIYGYTPLIIAVRVGDLEIAKLLLDYCADINIKDNQGKTAIATAENYSKIEDMINLLKEYGAKTTEQANKDLLSAAKQENLELVKEAIAEGADVNAKINNSTALHIISQSGNTEIAKVLIDNKADVNIKVKTGITPLMVASYYGNRDIVKLLLDNGANANIFAQNGDTPLSIAENKNHRDIVNLLKSEGKLVNSLWLKMKQQGQLNQGKTPKH